MNSFTNHEDNDQNNVILPHIDICLCDHTIVSVLDDTLRNGFVDLFIDDENMGDFVADIMNNNRLKQLSLHPHQYLYTAGDFVHARSNFEMVFEGISNNHSIEKYHLYGLHNPAIHVIQAMTPMITNKHNYLQEITLSECHVTVNELQLFASSIARREIPLKELVLDGNMVLDDDDGIIKPLVSAFKDNEGSFPKKFVANLCGRISSNVIEEDEVKSIAHLLQVEKCTMEELVITGKNPFSIPTQIDDEIAIMFANALVHNKTLYKLDVGNFDATTAVKDAFIDMVCNISTINSTYNSNHTLKEVVSNPKTHWLASAHKDNRSEMWDYFNMNKNSDKKSVARKKILLHHFSGQFDMKDFEAMSPHELFGSILFLDKWGRTYRSFDVAYHSILFLLVKNIQFISKSEKGRDHKRRRV
jgi:hypothetical protein